jgi:hypothetical protein
MIRKCAWCGKILGKKKGDHDNVLTHGMCKSCLDKMKKEVEKYYKQYSTKINGGK